MNKRRYLFVDLVEITDLRFADDTVLFSDTVERILVIERVALIGKNVNI